MEQHVGFKRKQSLDFLTVPAKIIPVVNTIGYLCIFYIDEKGHRMPFSERVEGTFLIAKTDTSICLQELC